VFVLVADATMKKVACVYFAGWCKHVMDLCISSIFMISESGLCVTIIVLGVFNLFHSLI
jgi:hypothetical protein